MGGKSEEFQKFLDTQQYSKKGILIYEKIFGETYVSTGGKTTTEKFCKRLDIKPGQKVLDIGCGIGGSAFYLARQYGADVHGVDLSTNMVSIANESRAKMEPGVKHRVQFYVEDATQMEYPEGFYDVVYSRDTILHIEDKLDLFKRFYKCLKPGGLVLISDYCKGDKDHSLAFKNYVSQRGYHLLTVGQYGSLLSTAGFSDVDAVDNTPYFLQILNEELDKFRPMKDEMEKNFTLQDYEYICNGWQDKINRCTNGDQVWGYFFARKLFH